VTSLITLVINEITHLLQTEFRLARTEVNEKITQLSSGGILLGAGAVILLPGLTLLGFAIAYWLSVAGLLMEWAFTAVAVVVLLIGGGLLMAGINALRASSLVPERTLDQVRADFSIAKESTK